jgi:hypothetical protein
MTKPERVIHQLEHERKHAIEIDRRDELRRNPE